MIQDKTFARTSAVADVVPAAVRATVQHLVAVSVREPVSDQTRHVDATIRRIHYRYCVHHPRRRSTVISWKLITEKMQVNQSA